MNNLFSWGLAQAKNCIKYLFRDTFSADKAAPLGSPLPCDVKGYWTIIVDTENKLSISGGKLVCSGGKASPAWGDPGMWGGAVTRAAGLAMATTLVSSSESGLLMLGFDANRSTTLSADAVYLNNGNLVCYDNTVPVASTMAQLINGEEYIFYVVLKSVGAFFLERTGGIWLLAWVGDVNTSNSVYPSISFYSSGAEFDNFNLLQLPAPFNDDYGIATQRLSGARSAGDVFSHEADCLIEWTVTTTADTGILFFRCQDGINFWDIRWTSAGAITLNETVDNSKTARGFSANGSIANGQRIVVIADGAVIKVYANNVLKITYSSAINFQTATAGKIHGLGTGGAVSDIVTWPRYLSGAALAVMEKYSR